MILRLITALIILSSSLLCPPAGSACLNDSETASSESWFAGSYQRDPANPVPARSHDYERTIPAYLQAQVGAMILAGVAAGVLGTALVLYYRQFRSRAVAVRVRPRRR